jgi:RNA polymerase sigma factor (sigma-70 family)
MDTNDHDIYLKLASYSSDAPRLLTRKYYRYIVSVAMGFGIGQCDCEEIANDVLLKLIDNIHKYEWQHENSLKALIISITKNRCIDFIKSQKNQFYKSIFTKTDTFRESPDSDKTDQHLSSCDLSDQIDSISDTELKSALQRMNEEDRICLVMRAANHSYQEISLILKISEQNLRQRMNRVRKTLTPLLKEL